MDVEQIVSYSYLNSLYRMHEQVLRDFLTGNISAQTLRVDLEDAMVRASATVTHHPIVDMCGDFQVHPAHLIRLCDAVLANELEAHLLEPIGFCLAASDRFWWDGDQPDGERVANAVFDWSAPEINYVLTPATDAKFRQRLVSGEGTFTRADTQSSARQGS